MKKLIAFETRTLDAAKLRICQQYLLGVGLRFQADAAVCKILGSVAAWPLVREQSATRFVSPCGGTHRIGSYCLQDTIEDNQACCMEFVLRGGIYSTCSRISSRVQRLSCNRSENT